MQIVEDGDIILIDPMHDAAALHLLRKKLGDDVEDEGISELATSLDYMPLALVQAAAYIRRRAPRCSVRQYLDEYRKSDGKKTSLLNQKAGHLRRDKDASNSIIATWEISFNYIQSTRQSAADLLSLMSFFDRQGIHESLLRSQSGAANERVANGGDSDNGFDYDVLILRDCSFITVTRDTNTFEMHSLIQLATRKWLENHGLLNKFREHFIFNLSAEMPAGKYEDWPKCQALFPHARAALTQRPKDKESLQRWALLLHKAAWYAHERGKADEGEQMAVMSLEARSEVLGEDNAETLWSMNMVGIVRGLKGRWKEAESIHRQALVRREKVLGPEHPDTLSSMYNLARALDHQGRYEEAEMIYRKTLAHRTRVLEPNHPNMLVTMGSLAFVLYKLGKDNEAERLNRRTLARQEEVLGPEHPHTLATRSNLALVLEAQGMDKESEMMNRQTLVQLEKVLGPEHPDTLRTKNNLAGLLHKQGKYKEAELMFRQTLAQQEEVIGPEHPDTLQSMARLAGVLYTQGEHEEAELMLKQTLAQQEKTIGPEHPDTQETMNRVAMLLNTQGKHKEAELMLKQSLAQQEKVLRPKHPNTLRTICCLAGVLNTQGRHKEAELMFRQTLAQQEKVLGPDHLDTLTSIYWLAYILEDQHCYDESLTLYERACAGFSTVLGTDHPNTRTCHEDFAIAKLRAAHGMKIKLRHLSYLLTAKVREADHASYPRVTAGAQRAKYSREAASGNRPSVPAEPTYYAHQESVEFDDAKTSLEQDVERLVFVDKRDNLKPAVNSTRLPSSQSTFLPEASNRERYGGSASSNALLEKGGKQRTLKTFLSSLKRSSSGRRPARQYSGSL